MKVLKTRLYHKITHTEILEYGYLDKTDIYYQSITKVWWFLFIPFHMELLLNERVPNWAILSNSILGYADWKSSKPELIDQYLKQRTHEKRKQQE